MQLNSVKLDLNAVNDGVWFPLEDGARIKIAKWLNTKHQAFLTELFKKNKTRIEMKAMSDTESDKLMSQQWDHIVLGLEGMKDGDDEVKYSPQLIRDLSLNEQFEEFFKKIERISKDETLFRQSRIKELGENSLAS